MCRRTAHRSLDRIDGGRRDYETPPSRRTRSCRRPAPRRFDGTAGTRGRRAALAGTAGTQNALGTTGGNEIDATQAGHVDASAARSSDCCAWRHSGTSLRTSTGAAGFTETRAPRVGAAARAAGFTETRAPGVGASTGTCVSDLDSRAALCSTVRRATTPGSGPGGPAGPAGRDGPECGTCSRGRATFRPAATRTTVTRYGDASCRGADGSRADSSAFTR